MTDSTTMSQILIADGGSTKIRWQLRSGGAVVRQFVTTGVNPSVMTEAEVEALVIDPLLRGLEGEAVSEARYYGAGCKGAGCALMERVLRKALGEVCVTVGSDMLGACYGLLADRPGVVSILGTGANSCLYDGREIIANTPPMGFILGDEGSGTWLGKHLIADRFKGLMPAALAALFDARFGLSEADTIRRVYRPTEEDGAPNRFLASLVPFIADNIGHPYMQSLVSEGFHLFVRRNVMQYFRPDLLSRCGITDSDSLMVSFTGGVAYTFRDLLAATLRAHRLNPGIITASPL